MLCCAVLCHRPVADGATVIATVICTDGAQTTKFCTAGNPNATTWQRQRGCSPPFVANMLHHPAYFIMSYAQHLQPSRYFHFSYFFTYVKQEKLKIR
jgi:hypothetical protein